MLSSSHKRREGVMQFAYVILLHRGGAFCWVPFFLFTDVSGRNFSFVIRIYRRGHSFVSFHEGAGAISSLFSRGIDLRVSPLYLQRGAVFVFLSFPEGVVISLLFSSLQ